jgi:DNA-binding IclR family transcriptional regulator
MTPASSRSAPTQRVISVLHLLAISPSGLTLSEMSKEAAIPLTTCADILAELVRAKVADRTPDKRYTLGHSQFCLAEGIRSSQRVIDAASEILPGVIRRVGCSFSLTRVSPEGLEVLLFVTPGQEPRRAAIMAFPFVPPFGLAAVAFMSRSKFSGWLDSGHVADHDRSSYQKLASSMRRDRYLGWRTTDGLSGDIVDFAASLDPLARAAALGESEPITLAMSAAFVGIPGAAFKSSALLPVSHIVSPIFGSTGIPTHQIELHLLADSTTRPRRRNAAEAVLDAAAAISHATGGSTP